MDYYLIYELDCEEIDNKYFEGNKSIMYTVRSSEDVLTHFLCKIKLDGVYEEIDNRYLGNVLCITLSSLLPSKYKTYNIEYWTTIFDNEFTHQEIANIVRYLAFLFKKCGSILSKDWERKLNILRILVNKNREILKSIKL